MTTYEPSAAAEITGISLDALRYYEREGLIGPIQRSSGSRRQYDQTDVDWIGIVTCLRDAGLGIADLRRFTSLLRVDGVPTDRVAFLRDRRAELLVRLAQTQAALEVLDGKIAHYSIVDGEPSAAETQDGQVRDEILDAGSAPVAAAEQRG